jgi:hypothetical protein
MGQNIYAVNRNSAFKDSIYFPFDCFLFEFIEFLLLLF